jgi:hypothetical protein
MTMAEMNGNERLPKQFRASGTGNQSGFVRSSDNSTSFNCGIPKVKSVRFSSSGVASLSLTVTDTGGGNAVTVIGPIIQTAGSQPIQFDYLCAIFGPRTGGSEIRFVVVAPAVDWSFEVESVWL